MHAPESSTKDSSPASEKQVPVSSERPSLELPVFIRSQSQDDEVSSWESSEDEQSDTGLKVEVLGRGNSRKRSSSFLTDHTTQTRSKTSRSVRSEFSNVTINSVSDLGHKDWVNSTRVPIHEFCRHGDVSPDTPEVFDLDRVVEQLQHHSRVPAMGSQQSLFLPLGKLLEVLSPKVVRQVLCHFFSGKKSEGEVERMIKAIYMDCRPRTLKIMGILMLMERLDLLEHFVSHDIDDNRLPLDLDRRPTGRRIPHMVDRNRNPIDGLGEGVWKYSEAEAFINKQMSLCSPFFFVREDLGRQNCYELPEGSILPFLSVDGSAVRSGGFGTVSKVQIAPSHLGCAGSAPRPTVLAVKRLYRHDTKDQYPPEVEALAKRIAIPKAYRQYVSRLLFAFFHGNSFHLAFEWADGTLEDFWRESLPKLDPCRRQDAQWFFEQCHGLSKGLSGIHTPRQSIPLLVEGEPTLLSHHIRDAHGRHTDIKPANILVYSGRGGVPGSNGPGLVLGDLGCAQFHTVESKSIVRISNIEGYTQTYGAPEIDTVRQVGQEVDIWALGCVFLEHASVFIKGDFDVLDDFATLRNAEDVAAHGSGPGTYKYTGNSFYFLLDLEENERGTGFCKAVTKRSVIKWIAELRAHPKCSAAMIDFLSLIENSMLVPRSESSFDNKTGRFVTKKLRFSSEQVRNQIGHILETQNLVPDNVPADSGHPEPMPDHGKVVRPEQDLRGMPGTTDIIDRPPDLAASELNDVLQPESHLGSGIGSSQEIPVKARLGIQDSEEKPEIPRDLPR